MCDNCPPSISEAGQQTALDYDNAKMDLMSATGLKQGDWIRKVFPGEFDYPVEDGTWVRAFFFERPDGWLSYGKYPLEPLDSVVARARAKSEES